MFKKHMERSMKTHESEEMYLETILLLKTGRTSVRSIDIVEELGYAKSSVSRAVNLLAKKGLIEMDQNGGIVLTERGQRKAEDVYEKHRVFTEVFMHMGADKALAEENACRVEHVISDDLFEILKKYLDERKTSD